VNKSESIDELAAALAKAQGSINDAVKSASNPYFKSKYADLAAVRAAVREPLTSNGLAISQIAASNDQAAIVETVLMHSSGQWVSGVLAIPVTKRDAQGYGSAISYARRYGLMAILGMASDDDDDANSAVGIAPQADGANQALLDEAKKKAQEGKQSLTEWWKSLPQDKRKQFRADQLSELKAIAEGANGTAVA
jgi:ERF superfamily